MTPKRTAKQLGHMVGLDAKEVNLKLRDLGYLSGKPGDWTITEKGKQYGEMNYYDNGYGGYAHRDWAYPKWDQDIAYQIGDPDSHLQVINDSRRALGFDELKSWNEEFDN